MHVRTTPRLVAIAPVASPTRVAVARCARLKTTPGGPGPITEQTHQSSEHSASTVIDTVEAFGVASAPEGHMA